MVSAFCERVYVRHGIKAVPVTASDVISVDSKYKGPGPSERYLADCTMCGDTFKNRKLLKDHFKFNHVKATSKQWIRKMKRNNYEPPSECPVD